MDTKFSIRWLFTSLAVLLMLLTFSGCGGDPEERCEEGDCSVEDYLYEYPYLLLLQNPALPGTPGAPANTCPDVDNTIPGSCNFTHDCIDYNPYLAQYQAESECAALGGTHAAKSCALQRTEGIRVGTCRLEGDCDGSVKWLRYYDSGYTAATAQTNCSLAGGVYIPD